MRRFAVGLGDVDFDLVLPGAGLVEGAGNDPQVKPAGFVGDGRIALADDELFAPSSDSPDQGARLELARSAAAAGEFIFSISSTNLAARRRISALGFLLALRSCGSDLTPTAFSLGTAASRSAKVVLPSAAMVTAICLFISSERRGRRRMRRTSCKGTVNRPYLVATIMLMAAASIRTVLPS